MSGKTSTLGVIISYLTSTSNANTIKICLFDLENGHSYNKIRMSSQAGSSMRLCRDVCSKKGDNIVCIKAHVGGMTLEANGRMIDSQMAVGAFAAHCQVNR